MVSFPVDLRKFMTPMREPPRDVDNPESYLDWSLRMIDHLFYFQIGSYLGNERLALLPQKEQYLKREHDITVLGYQTQDSTTFIQAIKVGIWGSIALCAYLNPQYQAYLAGGIACAFTIKVIGRIYKSEDFHVATSALYATEKVKFTLIRKDIEDLQASLQPGGENHERYKHLRNRILEMGKHLTIEQWVHMQPAVLSFSLNMENSTISISLKEEYNPTNIIYTIAQISKNESNDLDSILSEYRTTIASLKDHANDPTTWTAASLQVSLEAIDNELNINLQNTTQIVEIIERTYLPHKEQSLFDALRNAIESLSAGSDHISYFQDLTEGRDTPNMLSKQKLLDLITSLEYSSTLFISEKIYPILKKIWVYNKHRGVSQDIPVGREASIEEELTAKRIVAQVHEMDELITTDYTPLTLNDFLSGAAHTKLNCEIFIGICFLLLGDSTMTALCGVLLDPAYDHQDNIKCMYLQSLLDKNDNEQRTRLSVRLLARLQSLLPEIIQLPPIADQAFDVLSAIDPTQKFSKGDYLKSIQQVVEDNDMPRKLTQEISDKIQNLFQSHNIFELVQDYQTAVSLFGKDSQTAVSLFGKDSTELQDWLAKLKVDGRDLPEHKKAEYYGKIRDGIFKALNSLTSLKSLQTQINSLRIASIDDVEQIFAAYDQLVEIRNDLAFRDEIEKFKASIPKRCKQQILDQAVTAAGKEVTIDTEFDLYVAAFKILNQYDQLEETDKQRYHGPLFVQDIYTLAQAAQSAAAHPKSPLGETLIEAFKKEYGVIATITPDFRDARERIEVQFPHVDYEAFDEDGNIPRGMIPNTFISDQLAIIENAIQLEIAMEYVAE